MKISVVTPSFRQLSWLKLCVASVADQEGVAVEHIVQDACSDDGTPEWLGQQPGVKPFVEKDSGMYDAINRGFQRASGEIVAWLNCDEQYLPGTLASVRDYFAAHPEVDALVSDAVVTDANGEYLCHRHGLKPIGSHLWVRFPVVSCALFVRRKVISEMGILLDTRWRAYGDVFWIMELVRRGVRFGRMRRFLATFTLTGDNLAFSPRAQAEGKEKTAMAPRVILRIAPAIILFNKLRMLWSGAYTQKPFDYSLYTLQSPRQRVMRHVSKPTGHWPRLQ